MIITNGNRRPKPALKMVVDKVPYAIHEINHLLSGQRVFYRAISQGAASQIESFKKEHAGKTLFAFKGGVSRSKKGKVIEISLYALPKDSVHEIKWNGNSNPTVFLKSDFLFDDKDVGGDQKVSLVVTDKGEYIAYDIGSEASSAISDNPTWSSLGRHPAIIQDDQLYLALPIVKHRTRKDALTEKKNLETRRIELVNILKGKKGSVTIEDGRQNPSKPRKAYMTSTTDLSAIQDGRYPAIVGGVYCWLIKSTFNVRPLEIINFVLLRHDHEGVEEIPLMEVPKKK